MAVPPPQPSRAVLPIHNEAASISSLAKTMLTSLDRASIESRVHTASLVLLLSTLLSKLDRGAPPAHVDVATRSIKELVSAVETGQRESRARDAQERDKFHEATRVASED